MKKRTKPAPGAAPAKAPRCRTCGKAVLAGQSRCKAHLVAFRRWLRGLDGGQVFVPSTNGVQTEDEELFDRMVDAAAEAEIGPRIL